MNTNDDFRRLASMASALDGLLDARELIDKRIQAIVDQLSRDGSILAPKRRGRPSKAWEDRMAIPTTEVSQPATVQPSAAEIAEEIRQQQADIRASVPKKKKISPKPFTTEAGRTAAQKYWSSLSPEQRKAEVARRLAPRKASAQ